MRLIDADALLTAVQDFPYGYRGMIKSIIENQPTIEPPTTTWIGNYCPYTCQHCGKHTDSKTPYCPYCGRKIIDLQEE